MTKPDYFAHETAVIDEGCRIGAGTRIWHFSHVMPGARIGNNCNLGQNVFVAADVVLGNNVKVQNNVSSIPASPAKTMFSWGPRWCSRM